MMRILFVALSVLLSSIAFGQAKAPKLTADQERARTILEGSLQDKNPETRMHGVQALGLVGSGESYLAELQRAMEDKDLEVQLAAITTLVDLRNKTTIPALRKALANDVPEVSFAAARALWALNDPQGREALLAVLNGDAKTSSGFLTKQKRDAMRMLHTPKTTLIFAVKTGAGFAPVPGLGMGISSLQGILSDPSVSGRAAAALLLSGDPNPDVLPALEDALTDADWGVRAAAVHAIALRNDRTLAKNLLPLLDDKKEAVRARAAAGYLRLTGLRVSGKPTPAGAGAVQR